MTTGIGKVFQPLATSLGIVPDWDWRALMFHLAVVAVAGLLLWLAVNRIEWLRLTRQHHLQTQHALFAELCQAHDLSRTDRMLLSQISQTTGANPPCRVFIDPQIIEQFAQNNPAEAEICLDLVRRLFGTRTR